MAQRIESQLLGHETCTRCHGTGTYGSIGVCFLCGGSGVTEIRTKLTKAELAHNAAIVQAERDAEDADHRVRSAARKAARKAALAAGLSREEAAAAANAAADAASKENAR